MAEAEPMNLPPEEAIQYFLDKKYHVGFDWRDTAAEQHVKSFTVAKMMEVDLLSDVRSALDHAIADGTTYEQFREEIEPTLRKRGWWGQQERMDPKTGETRTVQLGSPRRLETIFQVNVRTAYAEGAWQRIERVAEARPYLRYVATLDSKTRPQHRAWHGLILPVDHPFWETHYPPNGWRCRCSVTQWSEDDLEEHGWQVSPDPQILELPWKNQRTGKTVQVPVGIDPGWQHNVGKTSQRVRMRERLIDKVRAWPEIADAALEARVRDFESRGFVDFIQNARAGYKTFWPVAAIPTDRVRKMGLAADHPRVVDITPDTVSDPKHRERFTQFMGKDWARIQTMINDGIWQQDAGIWLVSMMDDNKRPWKIVLKMTPNDEILVTTYHRIKRKKFDASKSGSGGT